MDLRLGSEIWDESEIWSEMDLDRSGLMIWIWYWRKMMDLDRSGLMIWIWYWGKMMYISEDRTSKWDLASCQRKNVIIRGYPVFIKSWKSIVQKFEYEDGFQCRNHSKLSKILKKYRSFSQYLEVSILLIYGYMRISKDYTEYMSLKNDGPGSIWIDECLILIK